MAKTGLLPSRSVAIPVMILAKNALPPNIVRILAASIFENPASIAYGAMWTSIANMTIPQHTKTVQTNQKETVFKAVFVFPMEASLVNWVVLGCMAGTKCLPSGIFRNLADTTIRINVARPMVI